MDFQRLRERPGASALRATALAERPVGPRRRGGDHRHYPGGRTPDARVGRRSRRLLSRGTSLVVEARGRVEMVERDTRTIRISSGFLGLTSVALVVTEDTLIVVGDKEGGFGDIRLGEPVVAAYEIGRRRLARQARRGGAPRQGAGQLSSPSPMAVTLFEKIWQRHVVAEGPGGQTLLYVDRHLLHEGTTSAFQRLARSGRRVRRPDLSFATADHYVLTSPGAPAPDRRDSLDGGIAAHAHGRAGDRPLRPGRRPARHRARDRAGAGPHAARDAAGVRRQPHRHARRAGRAGLRHRLERGRARAGHADAVAAQAQDACASRSTGGWPPACRPRT